MGGSGWTSGKTSLKERSGTDTAARGVGGSPSPEVSQNRRDVALRDVVWCHGGDGVGLVISELFPTFMTVGFILRVAFTSMQ